MTSKEKTFKFNIEGIPCTFTVSDKGKLKQVLLAMNEPAPKGIPVAKIKKLRPDWKKPVKFRLAIYNGNVPIPVGADVEGDTLDDLDSLDD